MQENLFSQIEKEEKEKERREKRKNIEKLKFKNKNKPKTKKTKELKVNGYKNNDILLLNILIEFDKCVKKYEKILYRKNDEPINENEMVIKRINRSFLSKRTKNFKILKIEVIKKIGEGQ